MSLHTWHRQGPHKPSSCTTFTLSPHWGRAATGKRALPLCMQGRCSCVQLCDSIDCGLPGFFVGVGDLQARTLECIDQYRFPYPSRALCFLLPWPPTPLSPWCCQNPRDTSSCTASTPGPHWGRPKSSRAASGANPSGRSTCRGGNKTTMEAQGPCG